MQEEKIIFITRKIPDAGLKILGEQDIKYDIGNFKRPPQKKDLIKALKKKPYVGVISFLTDKIDKDVFDACPTAKIYANFAVGYDNFNIEDAKSRNIFITNTPGTSATAVAEHTVALMLALTTRLVEGDEFMRQGKYRGWNPNLFVGTDLKGKTIGLIGAGQIGTEVAKMLHYGFGSNVIYSDVKRNFELENIDGVLRRETDEVLRESDIVSLHVPLLPTTRHLINKETLSTMKKTSFLINTSRGPVVDEIALIEALKNDTIRGAGLDVFEFEPKLSRGLSKLPDVIITPHIASARQSARDMMSEIAAKNIISVIETGAPINNVY
ncbi:MAG: D-glycerate dehydrogenase [Candidatus Moranbacteria bacterium]|nr:D-glycerate dehydrogenase [Candidatus Moranbacteria bacterium]